jgi:hypothetical protein
MCFERRHEVRKTNQPNEQRVLLDNGDTTERTRPAVRPLSAEPEHRRSVETVEPVTD